MHCSICGGENFTKHSVLWNELISDWQLSPFEVDYVNRQQGETCDSCGANLRSIALANALLASTGVPGLLRDLVASDTYKNLRLLEINEAGTLTPTLKQLAGYTFGAYPEVDMHAMPYDDDTFDFVVHSDTLEHIENPVHALTECRRVLKKGGVLCFTVPTIVGRLTRSREGLSKSYHGDSGTDFEDFVVQTEFGADAWSYVIQAGFSDVSLHSVEYPSAIAFSARKPA